MGGKRKGRNVNGILLLDKPIGMSSNAALQKVKDLFHARKAGHTGSLDPLADGLLPICFGVATKISAFLLDADKAYTVCVRLGITTTTGDAEGDVVAEQSCEDVTDEKIGAALNRFRGEIEQLPPMYSALKHKGQRLYKLARQGVEIERQPRRVNIKHLDLVKSDVPEIVLDVRCSKGTYIRTLAEDIGKTLGCGGHVIALTRTGVGPYAFEQRHDMETLIQVCEQEGVESLQKFLLPVDSAIEAWPDVHLSLDAAYYLSMGQAVLVPKAPTQGMVRLYSNTDEFIGVGKIQDDGRVAPKRLLQSG